MSENNQETKFCIHCGQAIPTNSIVCPKCGKQVGNLPPKNNFQNQMPQNNMGGKKPKENWYESTGIIIMFLIIFFPVGLFLMWKYGKWSKVPKIIVSVFWGLIIVANMGNNNNATTSSTKPTTEVKEEVKEEKTPEQTEQEKKDAEEKAAKEKQEADAKAAQKAEAIRIAEEKELAEYDSSTITFDNLARNPEQFKYQKVKFTGKIVQVIEGNKQTQYRMNINDDYNQVVLLTVDKDMLKDGKILVDDNIIIKGKSEGTVDYQTVLGAKVTIPSITVKQFQINR